MRSFSFYLAILFNSSTTQRLPLLSVNRGLMNGKLHSTDFSGRRDFRMETTYQTHPMHSNSTLMRTPFKEHPLSHEAPQTCSLSGTVLDASLTRKKYPREPKRGRRAMCPKHARISPFSGAEHVAKLIKTRALHAISASAFLSLLRDRANWC